MTNPEREGLSFAAAWWRTNPATNQPVVNWDDGLTEPGYRAFVGWVGDQTGGLSHRAAEIGRCRSSTDVTDVSVDLGEYGTFEGGSRPL